MPIYEYQCEECGQRTSLFFRSFSQTRDESCPSCNGKLRRLVSRVVIVKGDAQRAEELDYTQGLAKLEGRDRGSFGRWARKMAEHDSELGTSFKELAEKTEAGEDPVERLDPQHTLRYYTEKRKEDVLEPKREIPPEAQQFIDRGFQPPPDLLD